MTADHQHHRLEIVRTGLSAVVYPLRLVAAFPAKATHDVVHGLNTRQHLLKRNAKLKQHALKLQAQLQQFWSLKRENRQLRALMNAAPKAQGQLRIAEIMSVSLDPFRQQIILNKGRTSDVYLGQPVLGIGGMLGQITHVGPFTSIAILITDPNTAIPVEVLRSGLRTIAIGTGNSNELKLPYLPNNTTIRKGDRLVTSGLSGRFPRGYPVATVTKVTQKAGRPFAAITARPAAAMNRSHEVLLLWPPQRAHNPRAQPTSSAEHTDNEN